jgi:alpha-tubulin suppressor-like RCC1 family protein
MLGKSQFSPGSAAAIMALAFAATACNPESATTGPSGLSSKDFAANLRLVSGDQQLGPLAAALALPIVVRVVDAGGQPVQGATVSFSVRAGGGSVNPAANISGADGLVSATWTMGTTLGENKVAALLSGAFPLDSALFKATATVGPANKFAKISGDSQTLNASRRLPAPLVVRVQDAFGNNLSGIPVNWTTGNLSGSVAALRDTTAADGTASAAWTLGTVAIGQTVSASVVGSSGIAPIGFFALATTDTGRTFSVVQGGGQLAAVGAALPVQLQVRVTDQHGNLIQGALVTWNDSLAGGGSMSTLAGITSAQGTAGSNWTLGRRAGGQLVRAKLAGRTETVTFTANAFAPVSDVAAGNFSACALASDGTSMCWGYGADGQLGKLSNFRNTNAITTSVSTADTLAGPFLTFRQMSVGKNHTCGVSIARDIYCWGANAIGQIGGIAAGGTAAKWLSTQVFQSVSAGEFNTCAVTPTGAIYCSGANDQGQMGNAAFGAAVVAPTIAAQGGLAAGNLYSAVTVGMAHSCAMRQFNGTAVTRIPLCWGFNNNGQVGNSVTGGMQTSPVQISLPAGVAVFAADSTSLVTGNLHSCVITTTPAGSTWCSGNNGYGQLGDNSTTSRNVATGVVLPAGVTFVQLSAGAFHTCGLSSGGVAYCWGRNGSGQLGDGTTTDARVPVAVSTTVTFRSISAGELFTCGVAGVPAASGGTTTTSADVYCWGDNEYGQIGNTTLSQANNTPRLTPIKISFTP